MHNMLETQKANITQISKLHKTNRSGDGHTIEIRGIRNHDKNKVLLKNKVRHKLRILESQGKILVRRFQLEYYFGGSLGSSRSLYFFQINENCMQVRS